MKTTLKETPQEVQDRIFSRMSADERVKVGAQLWKLAKALVGKKINHSSSSSSGIGCPVPAGSWRTWSQY